ncbi:MAG: YceI family protein [Bacteroidia bacterium]
MNRYILLTGLCLAQTAYKSDSLGIRFYSDAPFEKIEAFNTGSFLYLNAQDSVFCRVPIKLFRFANRIMQDHFNENYMESDKYPYAYFHGKIQRMTADTVLATGELEIHNIKQKRTIPIYLNPTGEFYAHFKVRLRDHNIQIPKLVIKKIAEEVDVYVQGRLVPVN